MPFLRGRVRPRTGITTPSVLRAAIVLCAIAIAAFGFTATRATLERRAAAEDVRDAAGRVLLDAQQLYVALADADAAASTIYLRAGVESAELRGRYLDDLTQAGQRLAAVASADLGPRADGAVRTISQELSLYAGRVDTARTNSRLGYPLGAASLRRASDQMRSTILPAALTIYADAARALGGRYADATAPSTVVAVAITCLVALTALVLAHVYVTWRSKRRLNAGMLVAVAVLVGAAATTWLMMSRQADAMIRSRDEGADLVTTLATARILSLRAVSDENLDLIEHGTEPTYVTDFAARVRSLGVGRPDGLLDRAARAAPDAQIRQGLTALEQRFDAYLAAHTELRRQVDGADHAALLTAMNRGTDAAQAVDDELNTLIEASAAKLRREADGAVDLAVLVPIILVTTLVGVAAVVLGLRPRLREYR